MQPQPSDDFLLGVVGQVLGEHRISRHMWKLQVVQEVTEVDERKRHNYCNS